MLFSTCSNGLESKSRPEQQQETTTPPTMRSVHVILGNLLATVVEAKWSSTTHLLPHHSLKQKVVLLEMPYASPT